MGGCGAFTSSLLGLLAKIKCSNCSIQINTWIVGYSPTLVLIWFLKRESVGSACRPVFTGRLGIAVQPWSARCFPIWKVFPIHISQTICFIYPVRLGAWKQVVPIPFGLKLNKNAYLKSFWQAPSQLRNSNIVGILCFFQDKSNGETTSCQPIHAKSILFNIYLICYDIRFKHAYCVINDLVSLFLSLISNSPIHQTRRAASVIFEHRKPGQSFLAKNCVVYEAK